MITLDQADRLIDAILKRGAELDCRPLSVIVVEPGCKVKAFKKEDGASMIRFEMAFGKAYAALAMGRSSKLVKVRAEEKPIFMRYLLSATGDQIFPEGGGMQIRDAQGEVIGAVGVTGDTEDRDEELAAHGIRAIGLKTDEDCAQLGRRGGVRLTRTGGRGAMDVGWFDLLRDPTSRAIVVGSRKRSTQPTSKGHWQPNSPELAFDQKTRSREDHMSAYLAARHAAMVI